ncbi:MAG: efflux RND transporter periplasmic adaptor subunit [Planctomycetes bacterium]|nr:efflux RND transporter periplasmic adaptor subunit [Planctomycetota bacterium]
MTTRIAVRGGLLALSIGCAATLVWAHAGHDDSISAKGIKQDADGNLVIAPPARKAIGLSTVDVQIQTVKEELRLNARVVVPWSRKGFASTRIEGMVREIHVRPGQVVKSGATLATLASLPLEVLRLEAEQGKIELALAQQNLARAEELGEAIVPGREIIALRARRDRRKNRLASLREKLKAVGVGEKPTIEVYAPLGGVVVEVDVASGQHVEPSQHLFEIHDLSQVWVEVEVPEAHVGRVQVGQEVEFTFATLPGRSFKGEIGLAAAKLDPHLHQREVFVALENPKQELLPGMFGAAIVILSQVEDAFVVPRSAVVTDGAERYVFQQIKEGTYSKKKIVTGTISANTIEVVEGLYPGDVVVAQGNHQLSALFLQGTLQLSEEARRTIGFATEEVKYRAVDRVIEVNAQVTVPVSGRSLAASRMAGKVEAIRVKLGERVEAGQVLAEVHSLELQNAQLDLVLAHLNRGVVYKQLERLRPLGAVAPRKELARLESELGLENSQIAALGRRLLLMGLDKLEIESVRATGRIKPAVAIKAQSAGRVADIHVVLGQVVQAGDPLFEILETSRVWVEGAFFESDLHALRTGKFEKPAVVRTVARSDEALQTRLSFFNPVLGKSGQYVTAYAELTNAQAHLLPGMQARLIVTLETPKETVIAVPLRAILTLGRARYVFVQRKDGFDRVELELGRRDARHVEALSGLYPGDQVVVSGVNELNNALAAVR